MKEMAILQRVMLACSRGATRLFRNNVGQAWTGKAERLADGAVLLREARPFHAGLCTGSSDLIGFHVVTVTADMVGRQVALFAAVEVKAARGRLRPEQANFIKQVRKAGGIAGVARSDEEALALFDTYRSSDKC
jgi:hypothetical protein